jgi:DsbC/DsbD-like thiol-disulfide interchange protein
MLAARTGIERYRDKANASLTAFSEAITEHPSRYAYMLLAADELLHGEVGMRRYGARGAVKVTAKLEKLATDGQETGIVVELNIGDGWHINAHQPLQKNLIATVVSLDDAQKGWQLGQVYYPKPDYLRLSFQRATLALYQGKVRLHGKISPKGGKGAERNIVPVKVQFQACDDKRCLPPEEMVFNLARGRTYHHESSTTD